jgi:hypothetical protein
VSREGRQGERRLHRTVAADVRIGSSSEAGRAELLGFLVHFYKTAHIIYMYDFL